MVTPAAYTLMLIVVLVAVLAALLTAMRRRYPDRRDALIDVVDALLPQTQCAQCGYPGCRPYAQAVIEGAPLNLCPPGGSDTQRELERVLNRTQDDAVAAVPSQVALIDEARCIGCFLCVQACPVDAIIGAPQLMHTVLSDACTGCELCLPPCPVDCIDLVALPAPAGKPRQPQRRDVAAPEQPCIRCGHCAPVCPVDLVPQELLWYARAQDWHAAQARGLANCIECGLCNQVCPSNIDLVQDFRRGRRALTARGVEAQRAQEARARFERHELRKAARDAALQARRARRLQQRQARSWEQ